MLAFIAGAAFAATIYGVFIAAFVDVLASSITKSNKDTGALFAGGSIVLGCLVFALSLAIAAFS